MKSSTHKTRPLNKMKYEGREWGLCNQNSHHEKGSKGLNCGQMTIVMRTGRFSNFNLNFKLVLCRNHKSCCYIMSMETDYELPKKTKTMYYLSN
jgi:hypothetical protein